MTDGATRHNQAWCTTGSRAGTRTPGGPRPLFPDLMARSTGCLPPVADVADLACGPARDQALLAQAGHRVTGIDRSTGMLALAALAMPGRATQADLRSLPLAGENLDGIWCCAALLHVPDAQTVTVLGETPRAALRGHLATGHRPRARSPAGDRAPTSRTGRRLVLHRVPAALAGQLWPPRGCGCWTRSANVGVPGLAEGPGPGRSTASGGRGVGGARKMGWWPAPSGPGGKGDDRAVRLIRPDRIIRSAPRGGQARSGRPAALREGLDCPRA